MVVNVHGKPIFHYGDISQTSYLASARKSLIAMLYGPSVERGTIRLDATLSELGFDDVGGLLPIERTATVRDLLMARSGVYHPAANAGDASALAPPRGSVKPGSYFLYNNWDFNAAEAIYEKSTGETIRSAFNRDIAQAIGMEDWKPSLQIPAIRNDTGKSLYPAHHFVLSTRDMARLGQVMLQGGAWQGRNVLPTTWVRRISSLQTSAAEVAKTSPFEPGLGYGYLWWIFDPTGGWSNQLSGAYTASGAYGQFITVVPKLDMVVAHKTVVPPPRNVSASNYLKQILPSTLTLID